MVIIAISIVAGCQYSWRRIIYDSSGKNSSSLLFVDVICIIILQFELRGDFKMCIRFDSNIIFLSEGRSSASFDHEYLFGCVYR